MDEFTNIDLQGLPTPTLVEEKDFEDVRSSIVDQFTAMAPEYTEAISLPSDPITKLIDIIAYRELIVRKRINYAAQQNFVSTATAENLDHLAALVGVKRVQPEQDNELALRVVNTLQLQTTSLALSMATLLEIDMLELDMIEDEDVLWVAILEVLKTNFNVITDETVETVRIGIQRSKQQLAHWLGLSITDFETDEHISGRIVKQFNDGIDGVAALLGMQRFTQENDASLRHRIPLAFEQASNAGTLGAYHYHALSAAPSEIKNVAIGSEQDGTVNVYIMANTPSGEASVELTGRVLQYLNQPEIRPITDSIKVDSVKVQLYDIQAEITLDNNSAKNLIKDEVKIALNRFIQQQHNVNQSITQAGIIAALFIDGVKNVRLIQPEYDLPAKENCVYYTSMPSVDISTQVYADKMLLNVTPLEEL